MKKQLKMFFYTEFLFYIVLICVLNGDNEYRVDDDGCCT